LYCGAASKWLLPLAAGEPFSTTIALLPVLPTVAAYISGGSAFIPEGEATKPVWRNQTGFVGV